MKWGRFKDFVREMRTRQNKLIQEQGGSNSVMIAVSVVCKEINDWIDFPPHRIDLKTGKVNTFVDGIYQEVNVKKLLEELYADGDV